MSSITTNDSTRTATIGASATTAYLKLQNSDALSATDNSVTINKQLEVTNSMTANNASVTISNQIEVTNSATIGTNLQSKLISLIRQTMYPVGSLYVSMSPPRPETVLGFGEWTQIVDRFLYCAASSGVTGGESTHTLTIEEMPSHTHEIQQKGYWSVKHEDGGSMCKSHEEVQEDSWESFGLRSLATGGRYDSAIDRVVTQPHNNMPPCMTVYCWQRTK